MVRGYFMSLNDQLDLKSLIGVGLVGIVVLQLEVEELELEFMYFDFSV